MKVAVIAGSNAILKYSYAHYLRETGVAEVDIYAVGACSSIVAVYMLLSEDIIGKYDYVIFEFVINDSHNLNEKSNSIYNLFAFLWFVASRFQNVHTTPAILVLPSPPLRSFHVAANIHKLIAYVFNIKCFDFHIPLLPVKMGDLIIDGQPSHYNPAFQRLFAGELIQWLSSGPQNAVRGMVIPPPEFSLLSLDGPLECKGTSLLTRQFTAISVEDVLHIPEHLYLAGISFWQPKKHVELWVNNARHHLVKTLGISHELFFLRTIGYSVPLGKGGCIQFTPLLGAEAEREAVYFSADSPTSSQENSSILVECLILSNASPFLCGKFFYDNLLGCPDLTMTDIDIARVRSQIANILV